MKQLNSEELKKLGQKGIIDIFMNVSFKYTHVSVNSRITLK